MTNNKITAAAYLRITLLALLSIVSLSQAGYTPQPKVKSFLQYQKQILQFPNSGADLNKQPVVGIVAQTLEPEMLADPRFANYTYYVMSSFVKFLEGAGARIVPLVPTMTASEVDVALSKINGVFLPGGDGDYYDFAKMLYQKIITLND